MEDAQFSEAFFTFLQSSIVSVDAAEILLLLYRNPGQSFSPAETLRRLGPVLSEAQVLQICQGLAQGGLARTDGERYQYHPGSPESAGHVKTLALAYEHRPVTLFRLIYALRRSGLQALADAFRIRKS